MGSAGRHRYGVLLVDLDGTVVDYARTERDALHEVHRRFFRMSRAEFLTAFHAANEPLWAAYREHRITLAELRLERWARMGAPPSVASAFEDALGRNVALFPEARAALRRLSRRFRLALVTDGIAHVQRAKLRRTRIGGFFEQVVIAPEVGLRKPDGALLHHTLDLLAVRARDALMIGDSPVSDGGCAEAAGVDFCWVNRTGAAPWPGIPVRRTVNGLATVR
ncbi:HAD-IA family hydrolase [Streptosporangium carneum]|uniref:Noncanonical pyrimidine nucleotidase, YjjG family protein n=1 Tax=Streptosporangium carneum TaxID=47481 RepID=A0A9W6I2T7_9ACTN|nr:HAD-IA family hydrolase [Streptosporangium carneum]GLK10642.1 noncanonical pyrimidine nucleotidase, YjjG family protein [Streptosporangium carneum]